MTIMLIIVIILMIIMITIMIMLIIMTISIILRGFYAAGPAFHIGILRL